MLERIDYLFVSNGVRHAELKKIRFRPAIYGFCTFCLILCAALGVLVVLNIVS